MYIEFRLPYNVGQKSNFGARIALKVIRDEMQVWGERYGIAYREKTIKYTHRITFDREETYSFWAMTWNADQKYHATNRYRIVSDLNNKI